MLGPDADTKLKPPGAQAGAMDVEKLTAAWLAGLTTDACPPCPTEGPCPDVGAEMDADRVVSPALKAPRAHAKLDHAPRR